MTRSLSFAARLALVAVISHGLISCSSSNDNTTTPTTYTIGVTVSGLTGTGLVLQDNGAANLTVSANGAAVFGTALASGAAYAVTVLTQPAGQTCSVTSGTGTVGTANVTNVIVVCVPATYTVSVTVSGLNGTLVLQDNGASNLTVTSNGAATFATALITGAAYSVTVLTQPTAQTCAIANGSGTIANANVTNVTATCTSLTEFLYGGNEGFGFAGFSINTSTGVLTALSGSPFAPQAGITGSFGFIAGAPVGNFLYYALGLPTTPTNSSPSIEAWAANSTTGALTAVSGSPIAGVYPIGPLVFTPSGSFAYGPNLIHSNNTGTIFPASISAYSIGASGALTAIAGSPFKVDSLGANPSSLVITPNGNFLYSANAGVSGAAGNITGYSINSTTGALTQIAGSPFAAAGDSIAVIFSQLAISPNGSFLYVSGGGTSGIISAYTINSTTGALTLVSGSPFTSISIPTGISITAGSNLLYVGGGTSNGAGTGGVYGYTINSTTGALTTITGSPFSTGSFVLTTALDASGQFLYAGNIGTTANSSFTGVLGFTINQTTGVLTAITGSPFASSTTSSATSIAYITILK